MTTEYYDPDRDPDDDYAAAREQAQREGKNILIIVGGNWCEWCGRLERFIERNSELKRWRDERYVTMRVSFGDGSEYEPFLGLFYPFESVPHFFVVNSGGALLRSQSTEEFEDGQSYDATRLVAFFKRWADPHIPPLGPHPSRRALRRPFLRMPGGDGPTLAA